MCMMLVAWSIAAGVPPARTPQLSDRFVTVTIKTSRQGFFGGWNAKHELAAESFREVAADAAGARTFEVSFALGSDMPRALQAMSTHDVVTEATFDFGRPDRTAGRDTVYAQLQLQNAYVTSFTMAYARGHGYRYIMTLTAPQAGVRVQNGGQTTLPTLTGLRHANGIMISGNGVNQALVDVPSFPDAEYPPDAQKAPANRRSTVEADSLVLQGRWQGNRAVFQPLLVVKRPGAASSDFQQAFHSGAVLHQLSISFNGPARNNAIQLQSRIDLVDAKVSGFQSSSDARGQQAELIGMTPQQAQVEEEEHHVTSQITWQ